MSKELWFDMTAVKSDKKEYLLYVINMGYVGIFIDENNVNMLDVIPPNMKIIYKIGEKDQNSKSLKDLVGRNIVVASNNIDFLEKCKRNNISTCYIIEVKDKETMEQAIKISANK